MSEVVAGSGMVIKFGDLSLGRRIGSGAFSVVYQGSLARDGATIPVAIKVLKGSPDLLQFLGKELDVLKCGAEKCPRALRVLCAHFGLAWVGVSPQLLGFPRVRFPKSRRCIFVGDGRVV